MIPPLTKDIANYCKEVGVALLVSKYGLILDLLNYNENDNEFSIIGGNRGEYLEGASWMTPHEYALKFLIKNAEDK